MKKKKKNKILSSVGLMLLLAVSITFYSCDNYLDEAPDNRQELKVLEDLQELLVSAYSQAAYNFIEWRTDNVIANDQNTQVKWLTENFCFLPISNYESQDSPTYLWNNNYNAIAHANQALESLSQMNHNNDDLANAIKGEALLTRAYNHFILANVFCQAYDEATATSELGIPYITAPEKKLHATYERGTIKETYEKIEADLLEGISLVSDEYYKGTGKYHFTKSAAYAFASRFFLWKKDYENCIKYSNMLLGEGVVSPEYCRDYAEIFKGASADVMSNKFIDPEAPYNLLLVRKETGSAITRYYRGYQPTADVFDEIYGASVQGGEDKRDFRWGYRSGAINPPKYNELFRYTTATTGFPYFIMNELRAEEVILNRIEAYVKTNKVNEALQDYNVYAPSRYKSGGELTLEAIVKFYKGTEEEAMMKFIIHERQKEFLREGMRWWDIKRFKLPITHKDIEGNTYELQEEDTKKAIQIPAKAIANGIEPNPN